MIELLRSELGLIVGGMLIVIALTDWLVAEFIIKKSLMRKQHPGAESITRWIKYASIAIGTLGVLAISIHNGGSE